jgi:adenine/guanine phosphoribosyltransferase-like PRPP-binding protein
MPERDTHHVEVAGVGRDLPLFEVAPGLRIAVLNILGDTELVQACAQALVDRLSDYQYELILTPEAKSIPLAHAMAVLTGKDYIVLRKTYKPYMGDALHAETVSITTGQKQTLYLDEKDRGVMDGRNVVLIDDVISTGSTLEGMRLIVNQTKAKIAAEAAVFTEGDPDDWKGILALGHLPLFKE